MKRTRWSFACSLFIALIVSATTGTARAAREFGYGVTYDPRIPLGSFRDFVPDISFGGLQAKMDYFPIDSLSLGLEGQYHLFQRGAETSTAPIDNGAVTGALFRRASFWSFLPTARWYFSSRALRPYAALGVGLATRTETLIVSDLSRHDTSVALIIQPSLGVLWRFADTTDREPSNELARKPLDSLFGLTASVTYAYTTADVLGANNVGYAGIQVGIYAKP